MQDTQSKIITDLNDNNDGLAEIVSETELPDLLGIADKLGLMQNNPAPPVPDWVNQALLQAGGRNKFGEPNFKWVWGQSETHHAWGQQRMKYPATFVNEQELLGHDIRNPNGKVHFIKGSQIPDKLKPGSVLVPRYRKKKVEVGLPFFIIERWHDVQEYFHPKTFFWETLEQAWEKEVRWDFEMETGQRVDNMGPFPSRGVYLHFLTVKTPDKKYRPITEDVIEVIKATLEAEQAFASGRDYNLAIRDVLQKRITKEQEPINQLRERMADAFNTPRLLGNASISVPDLGDTV